MKTENSAQHGQKQPDSLSTQQLLALIKTANIGVDHRAGLAIEQMCARSDAQDKALAEYENSPEKQMLHMQNAAFNSAINFAIEQGTQAAVFLRSWREGDTSEWPEFSATPESQS